MNNPLSIALSLFIAFLYSDCVAQSPEIIKRLTDEDSSRTIFYLPGQTYLKDVPWYDSIYLFPSFEPGKVTLATGYTPENTVRMNYNLYLAEMEMINEKNDTLQIKRSREIKLITISDHVFLHEYKIGYIEVLLKLPIALGARRMMITETYEHLEEDRKGSGADLRGRPSAYDRYYRKGQYYFFIGKDNKSYKPSRASTLRLFSANKKVVKDYLTKNKPDFDNKDDLEKLLVFCNNQVSLSP